MPIDFLEHLNTEQLNAVKCTEGPVIIIAGAGSGKTRVLTYRIAYLLKQDVDPFRVLALTFTNKAAREMKERIAHLIGDEARNIWMGTFHSIFARLLRREAHKIGYPSNFTIYDSEDSKNLLKSIVKEMQLNDTAYKPSSLLGRISSLKTLLISDKDYANDAQYLNEDRLSRREHFSAIFTMYNKRLYKSGAMDFDDLLFHTNMLLRDHPDVLLKYQDMFRYILVDEYQDTNFSQFMILRQLAARHLNICVVGDDAQSIYAFRGANIQNILNFQKQYPDAQVFKLEQNYRSTKTLVNAANEVIAKNRDQLKKTVWTINEEGEKISLLRAFSDSEEGKIIARAILDIKTEKNARNGEFAILYRTNAQSRPLEEALRRNDIPYKIYGGLSFYNRKEIKDLLAYFRLAINPHDEESLRRVINYPTRGIGDTSFEKLILAASDNDVTVWTVMDNLDDFELSIQGRTLEKISEFVTHIKSFIALLPNYTAYQMGDHIASVTGIMRELAQDKTPEGVSRMENVQELLNGLRDFSESESPEAPVPTLDRFMEDIALLTSEEPENEKESSKDRVLLMTIHAAKGLEFNYVFIAGMEENLFPSQMSITSREDLEEERRLFYVALTRAKKLATLTYSISRYRYGAGVSCEPSRFLEEISPQFLQQNHLSEKTEEYFSEKRLPPSFVKKGTPLSINLKGVNKNMVRVRKVTSYTPVDNTHLKNLKAGMKVEHERFGQGEIIAMEGSFPNNKALVMFRNGERKQLLIRFAKLKIMPPVEGSK